MAFLINESGYLRFLSTNDHLFTFKFLELQEELLKTLLKKFIVASEVHKESWKALLDLDLSKERIHTTEIYLFRGQNLSIVKRISPFGQKRERGKMPFCIGKKSNFNCTYFFNA